MNDISSANVCPLNPRTERLKSLTHRPRRGSCQLTQTLIREAVSNPTGRYEFYDTRTLEGNQGRPGRRPGRDVLCIL